MLDLTYTWTLYQRARCLHFVALMTRMFACPPQSHGRTVEDLEAGSWSWSGSLIPFLSAKECCV